MNSKIEVFSVCDKTVNKLQTNGLDLVKKLTFRDIENVKEILTVSVGFSGLSVRPSIIGVNLGFLVVKLQSVRPANTFLCLVP